MITEQQNDILSINQVQLLITRSLRRMHQYDRMIADIKYNNQSLRKLIKS